MIGKMGNETRSPGRRDFLRILQFSAAAPVAVSFDEREGEGVAADLAAGVLEFAVIGGMDRAPARRVPELCRSRAPASGERNFNSWSTADLP